MAFSRVSINYDVLGQWMNHSDALGAALFAHAEAGVVFAKAIAPVGPERDPHRGEFRDSIHAEAARGPKGGIGARIVAGPLWPEFGRKHREPYEGANTLRQTKEYLNSPRRSA
jgi:hypothetical protein